MLSNWEGGGLGNSGAFCCAGGIGGLEERMQVPLWRYVWG